MGDISSATGPRISGGFSDDAGPCLVVAGPTASGKSSLAVSLAQRCNGEIVNADSMQVYKDLSILTARPNAEEMKDIPHHLYGILDGNQPCTAGQWLSWAHKTLPEIWARGRVPIVVGGTGLYLGALIRGLAPVPDVPEGVRQNVSADYERMGADAFGEKLAQLDPVTIATTPITNRQRMIRAMEVVVHTGKPLSQWQAEPHIGGLPYAPLLITIQPDRAWLYERCDRRFLMMLKAGAWEQVKDALKQGLGPDSPVSRGLGTRAMMSVLFGEVDEAEAIAKSQQETRNYAKRQMTWFRNQLTADMYLNPPQDEIDSAGFLGLLEKQVKECLLKRQNS